MKINATPLAFAVSNGFRAGSIGLALDLRIHWLNPQGPAGSTSQLPSAMKPKLSASRFRDSQHRQGERRIGDAPVEKRSAFYSLLKVIAVS
jgi:hypothetical protein